MRKYNLFLIFLSPLFIFAQNGVLKGRVFNAVNNEPVPFANIFIENLKTGTNTDIDGNYIIKDLEPGSYNISCSYIGFKTELEFEVRINPTKPTTLDFGLSEDQEMLDEVVIKASPYKKIEESPVSVRAINASEIYRAPGGNRDISQVIQNLPGVGSTASFRNDIFVRGGAPNENRFYLDGIEIPNINHFATQGSSGGPVGMLNVNFIREVDFYSGAFPSARGNALSSIMDIKSIRGNDEKLSGTFLMGSSDAGITLDGPLGDKANFILSARRSYLQFLFEALGLPFLPTYNDFQLKTDIDINEKNKLTVVGIGAVDDFVLNLGANDGVTDSADILRNEYILGNIPVNEQWNYAGGLNWKHFSENSYQNFIVSRNHLNNQATKYFDNSNQPEDLVLDYNSQEIENKVRFEHNWQNSTWKWNVGAGYEYATYTNSTFNRIQIGNAVRTIDFDSELNMNKYALFSQLSKSMLDKRWIVSFGLRTDFNDYSSDMDNPLDQLSPRLSSSFSLSEKVLLNFNIGRYTQLPSYTVLGYRNSHGLLVNKVNNIKYINSDHLVGGIEYNPTKFAKITVESFYKNYTNYPFLINKGISMANLGGDFGVIGNEPANSSSQGRSYGLEFLVQQKLSTSIYGILSYTFVKSEFQDQLGNYVPSSWDNIHILNAVAGKKFKRNWELGMKFRFAGGTPYTPFDAELSALIPVWDVTGQGVTDWSRLNQERNPVNHGMDVRVDKKWFYNKWALNVYMDIQNIYRFQAADQPYLDARRDANGNPLVDPNNPGSYQLYEVQNTSGTVLPSIGLMVEF